MIPSFEKRVRAFAIDTSGTALFAIVSLPLGVYLSWLPYLVTGLAFLAFYFLPYFLRKGQTFGKRIQRIRVADLDGGYAPLWRILLRDLFKLTLSIMTFGLYMVVCYFFLSDQTGRTIHDYIFKTKVIDLEKPTGKYNYMSKTESMKKRGF